MDKKKWRDLYDRLQELSKEYDEAYSKSKSGRNSVIRAQGNQDIYYLTDRIDSLLGGDEEILALMFPHEETPEGRAIHYDDFLHVDHIPRDLKRIIPAIKEKIDSFEQSENK